MPDSLDFLLNGSVGGCSEAWRLFEMPLVDFISPPINGSNVDTGKNEIKF